MSLILASALITASMTCSWDRPGYNPFMKDVVAAVDYYKDIPVPIRTKLKSRMAKRLYDDVAVIKRDSIKGQFEYEDLRQMHFGQGGVCDRVSMNGWSPKHEERGLVYCEDKHCIIVPTVCRNVSRITRKEKIVAVQTKKEEAPLEFETAAGPSSQDASFISGAGGASSFEEIAGRAQPLMFDAPAAGNAPPPPITLTTLPDPFPTTPPLPPTITVTPAIPEPAPLVLFSLGALLLGIIHKRRKKMSKLYG